MGKHGGTGFEPGLSFPSHKNLIRIFDFSNPLYLPHSPVMRIKFISPSKELSALSGISERSVSSGCLQEVNRPMEKPLSATFS